MTRGGGVVGREDDKELGTAGAKRAEAEVVCAGGEGAASAAGARDSGGTCDGRGDACRCDETEWEQHVSEKKKLDIIMIVPQKFHIPKSNPPYPLRVSSQTSM